MVGDSGPVVRDATCAGEVFRAEKKQRDLYMMFDSSGSMETIDIGQTLSRWSNLAQAVVTFANDPANAGSEVGLDFFPERATPEGGTPEGGAEISCDVADYTIPNVPIDFLPGMNDVQANAIIGAIQGRTRTGGTPTVPALTGALQTARAWQLNHPARSLSVLLLTDGQPVGCLNNTVSAAAAVAQVYATGTPPIKTYVLGVGPDTGNLDAIAAAGGTTMAYLVTNGSAAQLAQALATIRKGTQDCDYNVAQRDGGTIDHNKVNVQIRIGLGGAGQDIYNVGNAANCSDTMKNPTGQGWYYDNPSGVPTKITLCPNSCAPVQVTDGSDVNLLLGCGTRSLPPPS